VLIVVGDEQLLAVTQAPLIETAADCAVKGTAKTIAKESMAAFNELRAGAGFKLTSLCKGVLRVFRW
jgi:hypothetical protein